MKKRLERCTMAAVMALGSLSLVSALASAQAQPALPPLQMHDGIEYMSGGIGQAQSEAMQQASSKFPLVMTFSQKAGNVAEFVANVTVVIKNPEGKAVLRTTAGGPYLFVKLPSGDYAVSATYNGKEMNRQAIVKDGATARLFFEW